MELSRDSVSLFLKSKRRRFYSIDSFHLNQAMEFFNELVKTRTASEREALVERLDGDALCSALMGVVQQGSDLDSIGLLNTLVASSALPKLAMADAFHTTCEQIIARGDKVSEKLLQVLKSMADRDLLPEEVSPSLCREVLMPLLTHHNLALADGAVDVCAALATRAPALVVPALSAPAGTDVTYGTMQLRYAGLYSTVLASSNEAFAQCRTQGFADYVLQLCRSSDTLVALVALELLSEFGKTTRGYAYLLNDGQMLPHLLALVSGDETGEPDAMLGEVALRSLGQVVVIIGNRPR